MLQKVFISNKYDAIYFQFAGILYAIKFGNFGTLGVFFAVFCVFRLLCLLVINFASNSLKEETLVVILWFSLARSQISLPCHLSRLDFGLCSAVPWGDLHTALLLQTLDTDFSWQLSVT